MIITRKYKVLTHPISAQQQGDYVMLSNKALQRSLLWICAIITVSSPIRFAAAGEVNIYSHRQKFLLEPFLQVFEQETGIKTNVLYASKGLAQRLEAEGEASPADVVLTVDIARLSEYVSLDLFQVIESETLELSIPAHLRSQDNSWFGLSKRARIIVSSRDRVGVNELTRYEDLAEEKWRGRICSRKGSHVYNRALLASIIGHKGQGKAEQWASALVANLARRPQGNDRAQAKAIYAGECDVAIMNHYYYSKMLNNEEEPEQQEWARSLRLIAPNQDDRGAHINISGAGVAKYAPNRDNAIKLLEFLVSEEAQALYANKNFEYPVIDTDKLDIGGLGDFKADTLPISTLAENAELAQKIIDRTGW